MSTPIRDALAALGVQRLVCAVHDRCLPSRPTEDLGCGSPASQGTEDFLDFLASLGFTGLQLGPPGQISLGNLSPYDSTAFSRGVFQLAARPLLEGTHGLPLLTSAERDEIPAPTTPANRCDYPRAFAAVKTLLASVHDRWNDLVASGAAAGRELEQRLDLFQQEHGWWLEGDSLHYALSMEYGTPDASRWISPAAAHLYGAPPGDLRDHLTKRHARVLNRYRREQLLLHEQHAMLRGAATRRGLTLQGDLQVGLSLADRWRWHTLFLPGYLMGAPPSRTNPEGQPWGYPVLDPAQLGRPEAPGPALQFLKKRSQKIFAEYDGLRIDHPHGFVCPWVYHEANQDPYQAVRAGARLFSVGRRPEHNPLQALDITRVEQLRGPPLDPWADGWVTALEEEQVERYATQIDALQAEAIAAGRPPEALVCEVLSTMPYPLARVVERAGLGRFRVTTKARVEDPYDVYLPSNAQAPDWIMVGTHDTPPIWRVIPAMSEEQREARARYAAEFLAPDGLGREAMEQHFRGGVRAQIIAEFAMLFASRARNVMVFVSDLLGEEAIYNRPGVVHPENWTLRVPWDFLRIYEERRARGAALDLCAALALALASRPSHERQTHQALIASLIEASQAPLPGLAARLGASTKGTN